MFLAVTTVTNTGNNVNITSSVSTISTLNNSIKIIISMFCVKKYFELDCSSNYRHFLKNILQFS